MRKYIINGVLTLCLLFTACTQVELCDEPSHPHRATVDVNYSWSNVTETPDSMVLISIRPIDYVVSGYVCSTANANGRYMYNKPEWLADEDNQLSVHSGELIFVTFDNSNENLIYKNVDSVNAVKYSNVYVEQKTYALNKLPEEYASCVDGWYEINTYAPYVLQVKNLPYQKIGPVGVSGDSYSLDFEPSDAYRTVTLEVELQNEGVDVEKIIGELSGVYYQFNLIKGSSMKSKTAKTLFEMQKAEGDTYKASLSLLGLETNNSLTSLSGAGVLQLAIHTIAPDGNKNIYTARINLMNTLYNVRGLMEKTGEDFTIHPALPLIISQAGLTAPDSSNPYTDKWSVSK